MAKIKVYQAKEENMDAVKISLMLRNKTQLLKNLQKSICVCIRY